MDSSVAASCGGCDTRWNGTAKAHCSGCHRTFSTTKIFDSHRKYYKCVDPSSIGLNLSEGVWSYPPKGDDHPMKAKRLVGVN